MYRTLEAQWLKVFKIAQKYVLDPKGMDTAKEILAPYRGISDKTKLMQELFTKGEVYKRFRVAIGQKDFRITFELIKQHPFLKEFPEYNSIIDYADTLYMKSQELANKGDTHNAIKMLRILFDFPDYKEEAKNVLKTFEIKEKFYKAINEENIEEAYNLLDENEFLQNTKPGIKFQEEWNNDYAVATRYAVAGDVDGIKGTLKKYMHIHSKYMSLGTIFGWCYMTQLENAIKSKEDRLKIEHGIKNYLLSFGLQDQIESLFNIFQKYYKDTKLNLELQTHGSLKMWRPSMIVNSILD